MKLSFRRCLRKNNIFPAIFLEDYSKITVIISTEAKVNGCWNFSMEAKSHKLRKISKT